MDSMYDCVIVGSGPAGLTAATYLQSGGVTTAVVGNYHGGQMQRSAKLENLPFLGGTTVRGWTHAQRMVSQCEKFGVTLTQGVVDELMPVTQGRDTGWRVHSKQRGYMQARTVVIATGVWPRTAHFADNTGDLHYLPHLEEMRWLGSKRIAILGGGNSAAQAALFAAEKGAQVTMYTRRPIMASMSQYVLERIQAHTNILVRSGTQVTHVSPGRIGYYMLADKNAALLREPADSAWVYAGLTPRTQWLSAICDCDESGYIVTGPNRFNVRPSKWAGLYDSGGTYDTLFAIGDVRAGSVKRCATAAGEAASAAAHVAMTLGNARNALNQD